MPVTRISVRDLKSKLDRKQPLLILDVREGFCDSDRMIPGAVHIDAKDINPSLFNLPHDTEIIVYDNASREERASRIVEALTNAGYCAEALLGGWDDWLKAGFPTVDRQELTTTQALRAASAEADQEQVSGRTAEEAREVEEPHAEGTVGGLLEASRELAQVSMEAAAKRALDLVKSVIRR